MFKVEDSRHSAIGKNDLKHIEQSKPEGLKGHPRSVKLAIFILLSALGGVSSVLVGYVGSFLSIIPLGAPVSGQLVSGLHVYWLILSALILKRTGSATATGALKGLIEMILFSHLGILVLLISFVEGFVVDLVLFFFRGRGLVSLCVAGGFSAASNLVLLQLFLFPSLPLAVYAATYLLSFLSGVLLGGFLALKTIRSLRGILPSIEHMSKKNSGIKNEP